MNGVTTQSVKRIIEIAEIGWLCQKHDNLDHVDTCYICKEHKKKIDSIYDR